VDVYFFSDAALAVREPGLQAPKLFDATAVEEAAQGYSEETLCAAGDGKLEVNDRSDDSLVNKALDSIKASCVDV
jgi:hypothetical protein